MVYLWEQFIAVSASEPAEIVDSSDQSVDRLQMHALQ